MIKQNEKYYDQFVKQCFTINLFMEQITFTKGLLEHSFSRIKLMKVLSLALNINFVNAAEQTILPSFYEPEQFFYFKQDYANSDEIKTAIHYCEEFTNLVKTKFKQIHLESFQAYFNKKAKRGGTLSVLDIMKSVTPYLPQDTRTSQFDPPKYLRLKAREFNKETKFEYAIPTDDIFISFMTPEEIETRISACQKSLEMISIEKTSNASVNKMFDAVQQNIEFMRKIEIAFVIEYEKYDLVFDLARLNFNEFDNLLGLLKVADYIKDDSSISAYKALIGAASMRKNIFDYKTEKDEQRYGTVISDINSIMSFIGKITNETLIEKILLLAHGVITYENIKELADFYGVPINLVYTFFASVLDKELMYFYLDVIMWEKV